MTKRAHTTAMILQTGEYFVAHLDNGGVRLGMVGGTCFDMPATHADYAEVVALTAETVEDRYDMAYGQYCCA